VIASRDNPHIKAAVRLRGSAAQRRALGKFFLEGFRLCADALGSGCAPQELFLTAAAREKYDTAALESAARRIFEITDSVAQKLGETQHPQGVFAVCGIQEARGKKQEASVSCGAAGKKQEAREKQEARGKKQEASVSCGAAGKKQDFFRPAGRYVALENLQDPGNLGAAARTAEALGLDGLVAGSGCDTYHPKALRASMGALLRLPVLRADDLPGVLRSSGLPCYAAVPERDARSVLICDFTRGGIVAIGSEGHGLTPETIAACGCKITIPMAGRAESLNAAAAATILMWEMARQLTIDN